MRKVKQDWARHILAAQSEGGGLRVYAQRHGLALSSLYHWQRKLKLAATASIHSAPAVGLTAKPSSRFIAVRLNAPDIGGHRGPQSTTPCTLILAQGLRLEMAALPEPQWLLALAGHAQGAR
jgi:hypothetical protein